MSAEVQAFFQGFTFDTLLAVISCFTGVAALFVGGAAYRQCQIDKKSFDDRKKFEDHSRDHSQRAGRDIINHGCDAAALIALSSANFESSLKNAYEQFEQKTTDNLYRIIAETDRMIRENKINLGAYTKIDWINIYFESAKNASDSYMQRVWASVLAKELSAPGSFSYKTLDILKNMSGDDFRLFEQMCAVQVDEGILKGETHKKHGVNWTDCLKLSELGLLSLDASEKTYFMARKNDDIFLDASHVLCVQNFAGTTLEWKIPFYPLTGAARELLNVADYSYTTEFLIDYIKESTQEADKALKFELRKATISDSNQITFLSEDLLGEKGIAYDSQS